MAAENVAALVAGIPLICSAALKTPRIGQFAQAIYGYQIVPLWAAKGLAPVIVGAEYAAGLALVPPIAMGRIIGGVLALVLYTSFLAAMLRVLATGRRVPCGCFGTSGPGSADEPVSWATIARTGLLLVAAISSLILLDAPAMITPVEVGTAVLLIVAIFNAAAVPALWKDIQESRAELGELLTARDIPRGGSMEQEVGQSR